MCHCLIISISISIISCCCSIRAFLVPTPYPTVFLSVYGLPSIGSLQWYLQVVSQVLRRTIQQCYQLYLSSYQHCQLPLFQRGILLCVTLSQQSSGRFAADSDSNLYDITGMHLLPRSSSGAVAYIMHMIMCNNVFMTVFVPPVVPVVYI